MWTAENYRRKGIGNRRYYKKLSKNSTIDPISLFGGLTCCFIWVVTDEDNNCLGIFKPLLQEENNIDITMEN